MPMSRLLHGGHRCDKMVNRSAKAFMNIQDALVIDNEPFEVGRAADWLDGVISAAECSPRVLAMLQVVLVEGNCSPRVIAPR
jgi:hypothetical protein